jgi:glycosyltransferase involved in cell wall biosynthesis
MESPVPPLHIGILCDYGFTLLPKSGIGVFVYNLIEGLLTLTPRPRLTLLAHPGDQNELEELANRWQERVRILPPPAENRTPAARMERLLTALCGHSLKLETSLSSAWDRAFGNLKRRWVSLLKDDWQALRVPRDSADLSLAIKARAAARLALVSTHLGIGSWMGEIFHALILEFLLPTLLFPIRLARRVLVAIRGSAHPLEVRMAAAGCDVWLVPYPGTETPILFPHILVIFDLVFRHVPEVYTTGERDHFERLFAARARQATLIYCGSNFVRDHDLIPSYPFAADRVRVFRLAPPLDPQPAGTKPDIRTLLSKYGIGRRFLLYPAALRAHKNHSMLVRAFNLLRQKAEFSDLELVFTGEGRQSSELLRLVHSERLTGRAHFLGIIDRQDLLTLYQHALLVPLPSLHEGYGLPLLEALQNHCPVVCADIPAFRELLEGQDDAVAFFDPHDPASMANAIALTMARRDEFRSRQKQAFRQIARRDWHAVGQDFLEIFEEAYHLASPDKAPEEVHHAA